MASSAPALAGDAALAETLFRQARIEMEAGNHAAACPKLAESFAQDPATGTLLALAICREQIGQTAGAWAAFAEVAARARREGRPDRVEAAVQHQQALDPKLSRLTVEVDPQAAAVPGLLVKRDEVVVGSAAWGSAAPVDPGEHVVEATAPGKRAFRATVTMGPNADIQTVKVPSLVDDAQATTAAQPVTTDGSQTPITSDTGVTLPSASPLRMVGLVVGGVGVVGLGLSAYFGLHASSLNKESSADGHCTSNKCDPTGLEKRRDAISASNAATWTLFGGGVLAATGVTLFILGGPKSTEAARVEAVPAIAPGLAGLVVRGRL